ncbi:hypothetical protein IH992_26150 [Candidatus Poribacteria bacterium]|nr:hypothetical protein [Candidatus Poribacteria bacterium]
MNKTRALERDEIHRRFGCVSGRYAQPDRTMLVCGISMPLRVTELCQLQAGDAPTKIKPYLLS